MNCFLPIHTKHFFRLITCYIRVGLINGDVPSENIQPRDAFDGISKSCTQFSELCFRLNKICNVLGCTKQPNDLSLCIEFGLSSGFGMADRTLRAHEAEPRWEGR